eukprot:30819-Pelagococcus_subviridis.AAC.4
MDCSRFSFRSASAADNRPRISAMLPSACARTSCILATRASRASTSPRPPPSLSSRCASDTANFLSSVRSLCACAAAALSATMSRSSISRNSGESATENPPPPRLTTAFAALPESLPRDGGVGGRNGRPGGRGAPRPPPISSSGGGVGGAFAPPKFRLNPPYCGGPGGGTFPNRSRTGGGGFRGGGLTSPVSRRLGG